MNTTDRSHMGGAPLRRWGGLALLMVLLAALFVPHSRRAAAAPTWALVWSDEFNTAPGSGVDGSRWLIEQGGGGWGNNEHQYYTDRRENLAVQADAQASDGRALAITARRENLGLNCWYGACQYTSARLNTSGRFTQRYGRFEARLRLPVGQGIWPAFWMLGNDIGSAGWPASGEIDIMEYLGHDPGRAYGTIHGPGYSGAGGISASYLLPGGQRFVDAYHLFAVEWEPNEIRWYVDGAMYHRVTPASLPAGQRWVFDHPFFMILNLAVGGDWPGYPDASTTFPQTLFVDYVRVYTAASGGSGNPWNGAPAGLPGTIQAENFNTGGEGVAYHDADAANQGGAYRPAEGVDIGASNDTDGTSSVGWAGAGEWLNYTVNVASAGTYRFNARVASLNTGGTFHLEVDGANVSGPIAVPNTNGWSSWTTIGKDGINLSAGQHVLRVVLDQNGASGAVANFNWFNFSQAGCGAANVALGKAARSSSNENASLTPNLAVDGVAGSRWASAWSDPQWLEIDLGGARDVCRVVLKWEAAFGSAYAVQVSNDRTAWTTLRSVSGGDGGVDDLTGLSGAGRYVRIYGSQRATAYGYSLWEAEIYAR